MAGVAAGHDVAINATNGRHADVARALLEGLSKAGVKRLIIVGGASSLEVSPGVRLFDTPEFQDEWKPEAAQRDRVARRLPLVRHRRGVDLRQSRARCSRPASARAPTAPAASSCWSTDDGSSGISMEDFAIALLDEAERPQHPNQRFTAAY